VSKAKLGQSEKLATFKRVANLKNHQGFVRHWWLSFADVAGHIRDGTEDRRRKRRGKGRKLFRKPVPT